MMAWTEQDQRKLREAQAARLEFVAEGVMKVARLWLRLAFRAYDRRPRLYDFAIREAAAYSASAVRLRNEARARRAP